VAVRLQRPPWVVRKWESIEEGMGGEDTEGMRMGEYGYCISASVCFLRSIVLTFPECSLFMSLYSTKARGMVTISNSQRSEMRRGMCTSKLHSTPTS